MIIKRNLFVKSFYKWLKHSIYAFPVFVVITLILLTCLQIHGSSIGVYHTSLYTSKTKDHNLLYGKPQPIRSDEWKVGSPWTVLQSKTGFPAYSDKIASGRDVAIAPDMPVKDWVTVFRPNNWTFFAMPFENAFAFRWWFGPALLSIASYFFALRVLNGNKKLSILLSTAFTLSPFIIWWYQASLFIPFAYSLLIMVVGIRVVEQQKIKGVKSQRLSNALYVLALSYLVASFILYLYAPFLIASAIVVCAFLIGYLLDYNSVNPLRITDSIKRLGLLAMPILIAGVFVVAFVVDHKDTIQTIADSEYPGRRVVASSELPYSPSLPILGSFLMPLLQDGSRGANYYTNQSEASNFILFLPFLIIPGIAIQVYEYRKRRKIHFTFLAIQAVAVLFLIRISLPVGDFLYKFLLLDRVPNYRLIAGLGLVGFLQLLYLVRILSRTKTSSRKHLIYASLYGLACFAVLVIFGKYVVMEQFPIFLKGYSELIALALIFSILIVLFLSKKFLVAASLLLAFTIFSTFKILPLYQGTDFFSDSQIIKKIETISSPSDSWVVLDDQNFQQLPLIAGRRSIGGPQIYTDLDFWHQIDKDGRLEYIYNRQAHALFLSNTLAPQPSKKYNVYTIENDMELVKVNLFKIKFTCSEFTYNNIDYVLATSKLEFECLELKDEVPYPKKTFSIYKVTQH